MCRFPATQNVPRARVRQARARPPLPAAPSRPPHLLARCCRSPLTELDLHTSAIATLCTGDNSSHRAGLYPQPGAPTGHLGTDPAAKGAPALWYFKNTLQRADTNQRRVRADAPAARRAHRSPRPARGDVSAACAGHNREGAPHPRARLSAAGQAQPGCTEGPVSPTQLLHLHHPACNVLTSPGSPCLAHGCRRLRGPGECLSSWQGT